VGWPGGPFDRWGEHACSSWRGFAWPVLADESHGDPTLRERYSCSEADQTGADYDYLSCQLLPAPESLS